MQNSSQKTNSAKWNKQKPQNSTDSKKNTPMTPDRTSINMNKLTNKKPDTKITIYRFI